MTRFAILASLLASPCLAHPGHVEFVAGNSGASRTESAVTIEERDGYRCIVSNGIPNHEPGRFPNRNNPNSIAPQRYQFRVPLTPKSNDEPRESRGALFGVALNGVVFDPGTAEWWKDDPSLGWRMEAIGGPRNLGLDKSNAHVQPSGAYHYHGIPFGLIEKLASRSKSKSDPLLIGWAGDGFPIYVQANVKSSYRLKQGNRPAQPNAPGGKYDGAYTQDWEYIAGSGDLDECNGRTGATPEFPNGTYYYVVTADYPYIPRYFRGTPDQSFHIRRPPPGGRGRGPHPPR